MSAAVAGSSSPPSLLFRPGEAAGPADAGTPKPAAMPSWAADLRLDALAPALGPGAEGKRRLAVLLQPLPDADAVRYRQEVFRDLEEPRLATALRRLGASLGEVRAIVDRSARMRHPAERNRWLLDAIDAHDAAVTALDGVLSSAAIQSRGVAAARQAIAAHVASERRRGRRAAVAEARRALESVSFRLRLGQQRILVAPARDEPDLAQQIRTTFAHLGSAAAAPVPVDVFDTLDMNPIEAEVLGRVGRLSPAPFALLADTIARQQLVLEPWIVRLADEAGWYLAVLDLVAPLTRVGARTSYPSISTDGALHAEGLFDLVLARELAVDGRPVATSNIDLARDERLAVVTGPSQGGRTSFVRALGQLHVLAAAGCPVAAATATVPLIDAVHTVFDRVERLDDPGGRLRGELRGVRALLESMTPSSVVVANEPFASTTAADALVLTRRLLRAVERRAARAFVVTFLEELSTDDGVVSLAAVPDQAEPTARTFRFERRAADGLAHAQALAASHGLGASTIRERVSR